MSLGILFVCVMFDKDKLVELLFYGLFCKLLWEMVFKRCPQYLYYTQMGLPPKGNAFSTSSPWEAFVGPTQAKEHPLE